MFVVVAIVVFVVIFFNFIQIENSARNLHNGFSNISEDCFQVRYYGLSPRKREEIQGICCLQLPDLSSVYGQWRAGVAMLILAVWRRLSEHDLL